VMLGGETGGASTGSSGALSGSGRTSVLKMSVVWNHLIQK